LKLETTSPRKDKNMPVPTNAQKAAVWLVITMDSHNFDLLMTAAGDQKPAERDAVITNWHLDSDAVAFVKKKLSAADQPYFKGIRAVADGFHNELVSGDWGDDVCPDKKITAGLQIMNSPRTPERAKAVYHDNSGKES
jgi:hypothetical protein